VEPHICVVANRTTDERGEYVEIANGGTASVALTGLELTDYTGTQQRPHIYRFPRTTNHGTLYLEPGESAYVFYGLRHQLPFGRWASPLVLGTFDPHLERRWRCRISAP